MRIKQSFKTIPGSAAYDLRRKAVPVVNNLVRKGLLPMKGLRWKLGKLPIMCSPAVTIRYGEELFYKTYSKEEVREYEITTESPKFKWVLVKNFKSRLVGNITQARDHLGSRALHTLNS